MVVSTQGTIPESGRLGHGERILVVDDEPIILELMREILVTEGYHITTASNGNDAISLLQEDQFDLIVSDVVMPGMSGIEVLQAAFRIDPDYPVIMITGFPSVESAVKLVNLGAADYITKPFNIDTIKITISKVLKSKNEKEEGAEPESSLVTTGIDPVTGVYNYSRFSQLLTNEVETARLRDQPCSIVVVRIDKFDTYKRTGQSETEKILNDLVSVTKQYLRPSDTLGRTDESEFCIILNQTGSQQAEAFANRLKQGLPGHFTVSGGVATYPQDASDADLLVRFSRIAVQTASSSGGNRIIALA